jgi:DNA-binding transcriptional regulator GbsR (MarR family)
MAGKTDNKPENSSSNGKKLEDRILDTFAEVASSIGYSPLHGKIIGVLLVKARSMSLQDVARETGYSTSMVSLSLDLLEVLGVIKKVKKTADRKLYIELSGDLLECLKKAFVMKLERSISGSLNEFENLKKSAKPDTEAARTLDVLEQEITRLNTYVKLLSNIKLP